MPKIHTSSESQHKVNEVSENNILTNTQYYFWLYNDVMFYVINY